MSHAPNMPFTGLEPHPTMPLPTHEMALRMGQAWLREAIEKRRLALELERKDPLNYGYEPEIWKKADAVMKQLRGEYPTGVITELDLGGNRASKSERRAKRMVENMRDNPGWRAWALQSTQVSSRQNQQSLIYKYLPPEWKPQTGKLRQGATTKIVYSQAGGFTEDTLVCPNGSQLWFKFYSMDVGSVEGAELDEAWGDELITLDWIEALTYRLVTRNGLLGLTFTPIEGYTAAVKRYLAGAITLEEASAELLGDELVPRVQRNAAERAAIVYFHTADNPYGNYEGMKQTLAGRDRVTILMRAYGVPTKAVANRFPLFRDTVHVLSLNRMAAVLKGEGTRYHFVDPCSGRNWFMIWVFFDPRGRMFVYREWPTHGHGGAYIPGVGDPGPWATLTGNKADGERGPAQRTFGFGLARYKEEILRLERRERPTSNVQRSTSNEEAQEREHEEIHERWMDSRYGNATTVAKEAPTTLIEEMAELEMEFTATPGEKIGEGIELINDALYYDTSRPIDATNEPRLYVGENCPNLIMALHEWTGQDGQHGAMKDPIDLLRYVVLSDADYLGGDVLTPKGGGSY